MKFSFLYIALAIIILCFCPPDKIDPNSPSFVLIPSGSFETTSSKLAILIALLNLLSSKFSIDKQILSFKLC